MPHLRVSTPIPILIGLAVTAGIAAFGIWYALVRSVPRHSAIGVIKDKSFRAARTIERRPVGGRRQDWGGTKEVRLPDNDVFVIRLEVPPKEVQFSMPAGAGDEFAVGQRVRVEYEIRSLPLLWRKIYVRSITAVGDE